MEEIGPIGIWKYRSMTTRMSAAYAELAPEEASTLRGSLSAPCMLFSSAR